MIMFLLLCLGASCYSMDLCNCKKVSKTKVECSITEEEGNDFTDTCDLLKAQNDVRLEKFSLK